MGDSTTLATVVVMDKSGAKTQRGSSRGWASGLTDKNTCFGARWPGPPSPVSPWRFVPPEMEGAYVSGLATSGVVRTTSDKPHNIIGRLSAVQPKVIFLYFEYLGEDEALNQHEKGILEKAEAMSGEHSATIVADVADAPRSVERRLTPAKMRGDLAVFSDKVAVLKLITTRANSDQKPRSLRRGCRRRRIRRDAEVRRRGVVPREGDDRARGHSRLAGRAARAFTSRLRRG